MSWLNIDMKFKGEFFDLRLNIQVAITIIKRQYDSIYTRCIIYIKTQVKRNSFYSTNVDNFIIYKNAYISAFNSLRNGSNL